MHTIQTLACFQEFDDDNRGGVGYTASLRMSILFTVGLLVLHLQRFSRGGARVVVTDCGDRQPRPSGRPAHHLQAHPAGARK